MKMVFFLKHFQEFLLFAYSVILGCLDCKQLKYYSVTKTWRIDLSTSGKEIGYTRSLAECTSFCTADDTCCTGSYDIVSGICWIDSCCRPSISSSPSSVVFMKTSQVMAPRHCGELPLGSSSGIYTKYPDSNGGINVFCDMNTQCEGWIVLQRRFDGSETFYRNWNDYKNGFGNLNSEFWLGNENIYRITSNGKYLMQIELTDWDGVKKYAEYTDFYLFDESRDYQIQGWYSGGTAGNSLGWLIGRKFSTLDRDNDLAAWSCAVVHKGAWWYADCTTSNLNGLYQNGITTYTDGVFWYTFRSSLKYSLKETKMMIRKI